MFRFTMLSIVVASLLVACNAEPAQRGDAAGAPAASYQLPPTEGAKPWTHEMFQPQGETWNFVVMSDRTGGKRDGVFAAAIEKVKLLDPAFVMCVGDLIEGYTEDRAKIEAEWDEFDRITHKLCAPFFHLPGNHDIGNAVMADVWKERFGPSYYHFLYGDCLFLCLNSEDPPASKISDEQVAYVRRTLDANRDVRWTFVFMHKPFWQYKGNRRPANWDAIQTMLARRDHTLFTGHHHNYLYAKQNDGRHDYFTLATTGGASRLTGPQTGQFDHVVLVTMAKGGLPRIVNLTLDGMLDKDFRRMDDVEAENELAGLVRIDPGLCTTDAATIKEAHIEMRLVNDSDHPALARLLFHDARPRTVSPAGIHRALPPRSEEVVPVTITSPALLPVERFEPVGYDWVLTIDRPDKGPLTREGGGRLGIVRIHPIIMRSKAATIDGDLSDWPALPHVVNSDAYHMGRADAWKGPGDLTVRYAVAHDQDYLYIAVRTTDDTVLLRPGKNPWDQDGLRVDIDVRADPRRSGNAHREAWKDFLPINFTVGDSPDKPAGLADPSQLPVGSRVACAKLGDGIAAEIAIPLAYIKQRQGDDWQGVRVNILAYDRDDAKDSFYALISGPRWEAQGIPGSGVFLRSVGNK